jgi:hypothetical protein
MPHANQRIADLLSQAAELSAKAAELARAGKVQKALKLEREADELRAQARSTHASTPVRPANRSRGASLARGEGRESVRSLAISSLTEIGVPVSPRAVAEYALLRFGKSIDHRALASIRRDEQRAWSSSRTKRAAYIVPALEGTRFFAFRGKVAVSDWPLTRRLIGPWSERIDHLIATTNLARQLAWLKEADPRAGEALARLVAAYATSVPGALRPPHEVDPVRIEEAASAELQAIGLKDEEWRAKAAERAAEVLSEEEQMWGTRAPSVISERSA